MRLIPSPSEEFPLAIVTGGTDHKTSSHAGAEAFLPVLDYDMVFGVS